MLAIGGASSSSFLSFLVLFSFFVEGCGNVEKRGELAFEKDIKRHREVVL